MDSQMTCNDCRKFPDFCSRGGYPGGLVCLDFKSKDAEWFCIGCQAVVPGSVINEEERCLVCTGPVIRRINHEKDPVEFVRTVLLALLDPPDLDEEQEMDGGYCAVCGCTEANGCSPGGCYWVAGALCSACVHKALECINQFQAGEDALERIDELEERVAEQKDVMDEKEMLLDHMKASEEGYHSQIQVCNQTISEAWSRAHIAERALQLMTEDACWSLVGEWDTLNDNINLAYAMAESEMQDNKT
jgi:hypothetical protein